MRTAPVTFRIYDAAEGARDTERGRVGRPWHGVEHQRMGSTFVVMSAAGSNRDHAKGTRDQPYWDEHAAFIGTLVEEGFIILGGPLPEEGGAVLVVRANSEAEVRDRLGRDPGTFTASSPSRASGGGTFLLIAGWREERRTMQPPADAPSRIRAPLLDGRERKPYARPSSRRSRARQAATLDLFGGAAGR
jgi:hypothetical protein